MIKPDQIPDEVVEAAARVLHSHAEIFDDLLWEDISQADQEAYFEEARASIAAALNAWPGVTTTSWFENSVRKAVLNIPLPLEARDE